MRYSDDEWRVFSKRHPLLEGAPLNVLRELCEDGDTSYSDVTRRLGLRPTTAKNVARQLRFYFRCGTKAELVQRVADDIRGDGGYPGYPKR